MVKSPPSGGARHNAHDIRSAFLARQGDVQRQQQAAMHFNGYGYNGGMPWGDIV